MKKTFVVLVALAALAVSAAAGAFARSFEVSAWRGETVAARVPDFAEMGTMPEGFGLL